MTTQENEQRTLAEYDNMLWGFVHQFLRRCKSPSVYAEDLIQEARMAFLSFIRTHKAEELYQCRLTILHALCDAVKRCYPISMPRGVFLDRGKRNSYHFSDIDELPEVMDGGNSYESIELMNQIREISDTLSDKTHELVRLKLQGYSNREAARQLGISDAAVSRRLKQIRQRLRDIS